MHGKEKSLMFVIHKRENTMTKTNFFSQFSDEQIKKQYKANYQGILKLKQKAEKTGEKVNGYTLKELEELANKYKTLSQ